MGPPAINLENVVVVRGRKINTQNTTQLGAVLLTFLIEMYRMLTSSLLLLFIPQACGESTSGISTACTISQNLLGGLKYRSIVGVNFATLCVMFFLYVIEIRREVLLIKSLDVNDDLASDEKTVTKTLSHLNQDKMAGIQEISDAYRGYFYFAAVVYATNAGLSLWMINKFYLNTTTVTTSLTYVTFMFLKLSNIYYVTSSQNANPSVLFSMYLQNNGMRFFSLSPPPFIFSREYFGNSSV